MKTSLHVILCLTALCAAPMAGAVPVQYQFSGILTGELSSDPIDGHSFPAAPGDHLFTTGTPVSGTFIYDADMASLSQSFAPGVILPVQYGAISFYNGAVPGFSVNFGGHSYDGGPGSTTLLGNSNDATGVDVIVHLGSLPDSNLIVDGWTLNSWNLNTALLDYTVLSNQNLPTEPLPGSGPLQLSLVFAKDDVAFGFHTLVFDNLQITQVPVPQAGLLFASALMGLMYNGRRKSSNA